MSLPILALGLLRLVYFPLAVAFELRPERDMDFNSPHPLVTVVVPAFNEGRGLRNCVDSILASTYRTIEIILVDDGSTDNTLAMMRCYADHPAVTVLGTRSTSPDARVYAEVPSTVGGCGVSGFAAAAVHSTVRLHQDMLFRRVTAFSAAGCRSM
ncbi:MAG: glycosyltransferase [Pseudonocardiales bacterium]|nr:glycosyltransferase [Pseudonocardiales bacterium]